MLDDPRVKHRPSVWAVDDSPTERAVIARALSERFDLELFDDGAALLEALMARQPEALVLDWHLPDVSGIDVLRMVRQSYDEVTMPILVLTASGNRERDVLEALEAGANDFATKPFAGGELRARLATLIRIRSLHERATKAELAQQEARAELQTRADFEQQLIGIVSHDLRSPVGAISLGAQLLQMDPELTQKQSRTVLRIRNSANRAARLIADLLDFTAVRLGHGLPMTPQHVAFDRLVQDVVTEIAMAHPERELNFRPEGRCEAMWDTDRFSQVVTNLVNNALTYSPRDTSVEVATAADDRWGVLTVRNGGPPISEELRARLFLPMERGESEGSANRRGVGLGLYIVDHIVRAHQGTIDVQSTAVDSTVFTVRLPLAPAYGQG